MLGTYGSTGGVPLQVLQRTDFKDLSLAEEYDLESFADYCCPYGLNLHPTDGYNHSLQASHASGVLMPQQAQNPSHLQMGQHGGLQYSFTFVAPRTPADMSTFSDRVGGRGYDSQGYHQFPATHRAESSQITSTSYANAPQTLPAPFSRPGNFGGRREELLANAQSQPHTPDHFTPSLEGPLLPAIYTEGIRTLDHAFSLEAAAFYPGPSHSPFGALDAQEGAADHRTISNAFTDAAVDEALDGIVNLDDPWIEDFILANDVFDQSLASPAGDACPPQALTSAEPVVQTPGDANPPIPTPSPAPKSAQVTVTSSLQLFNVTTPANIVLPPEETRHRVKRRYKRASGYWNARKNGEEWVPRSGKRKAANATGVEPVQSRWEVVQEGPLPKKPRSSKKQKGSGSSEGGGPSQVSKSTTKGDNEGKQAKGKGKGKGK